MKACPECGLSQDMTIDPKDPEHVTLWENHVDGCSWSPMVVPTVHRWRMRTIPRTSEYALDLISRTTSAKP